MNKNLQIVLGLSLVLLLGLAGYVTYMGLAARQPVEPHQAESMAEQVQLNADAMRETLDAQIAGQPVSAQRIRLESVTGQALSRHCIEWTDFYENHPGDDARQKRDAACARYRDYVQTGQLPEQ